MTELQDNKYYIPTIEEFHVGFEYEFLTGEKLWKSFTFDLDRPHHVLYNFKEKSELFRVKYLDKEDIESLGFKKQLCRDSFDKGNYQINFDSLINNLGKGIGITIWNDLPEKIFEGYIKNKSEFKKLLIQLNIL